jgi:subtilase family serine protease
MSNHARRTAAAAALSVAAVSAAVAVVSGGVTQGQAARFVPGVIRAGQHWAAAPTTTQCQQESQLPCYDPAEIQQAYELNDIYGQDITGSGVSIAIVDAYGSPTIRSDLSTFDSAFSLPNPKLTIIRPDGRMPAFNPKNSDMTGWASETTLDVEWAHAIAPGASIVLVETPNDQSDPDYARAEEYVIKHHLASIISQSWGSTEGGSTYAASGSEVLHAAYLEADRSRVTVLAAAGDNGATNPSGAEGSTLLTYANTDYPATDPLVTAVGGTELYLDADGDHASPDTVWNDTWNRNASTGVPAANATGGGASAWFGRPSYQDSVKQTVGAMRGIPDVSMNAALSSPVLTYQSFPGQQSGWYPVAGTSEATPLMAGIVALADQRAGHSLGLINPALYRLAAEHAPGIVEVKSGGNTVTFRQGGRTYTVHGFKARDGYSRAAGVGTIDGQYFIPELARLG